jgi:TonB family protein
LVQPLPNYQVEVEAVITVRFEVRPDGSVGRIQPIRRSNPELESEITRTLRSWKFSRLPNNTPQESQFGVITFRFVLN